MPDVIIIPNRSRSGVGRLPRRELGRPLLPQHARLCPALADGSALGYLVYSPLRESEAFQVRYQADGGFVLSFFSDRATGEAGHVFSLRIAVPAGGVGISSEEVVHLDPTFGLDEAAIFRLRDAVLRMGSLGVPPGAVPLRGAVDFRTPAGWDTVFTGVLNQPQRPVLPALTARVETDWYANETEFRYLLQPGEIISALGTTPIGQVFFVPREPPTLRPATEQEAAVFHCEHDAFVAEKARGRLTTAYGLMYDAVYRQRRRGDPDGAGEARRRSVNRAAASFPTPDT